METPITDIQGTIIFTDIVGSSRLWKQDGFFKRLLEHNYIINNTVNNYKNATVVKNKGDSYMIFVEDFNNAINISIDIMKKIKILNILNLRIGMCTGPLKKIKEKIQDCEVDDYFGNTVNLAARMESVVADPGRISFCFYGKSRDYIKKQVVNLATRLDKEDYDIIIKDYIKESESCPANKDIETFSNNDTDTHVELRYMCFQEAVLKGPSGQITFTIIPKGVIQGRQRRSKTT